MWTNGHSRMQYAYFGDVVSFDTTYKTNLYGMPFGMFVGVNNHFQSVLFAGVLMRSESICTFKWIFREFVSMMGGSKPQTVLTDQAHAMRVAIEAEWVGTCHRWCKWHVLRLAKEHIGHCYNKKSGFKEKFHKLINSMMTSDEFEQGWRTVLGKYDLLEHPFIKRIYEERFMWAKPYFTDVFCAGQTSTQRSESANHMLKTEVPPGSPMHLFVTQYMRLLAYRAEEDDFAERKSKLVTVTPQFNNSIERHAMKIYSPRMMVVLHKQFFEAGYYRVECLETGCHYIAVHVHEAERASWAHVWFEVTLHDNGNRFKCDCGTVEHMGLLCCHINKIMMHLDIQEIPAAHILKCWTREARDVLPPHLSYLQKDNPVLKSQTFRHCSALIGALELVQMGDCNRQRYEESVKIVAEGKQRLAAIDGTKDGMTLQEAAAMTTQNDGSSAVNPYLSETSGAYASKCSTNVGDDEGSSATSWRTMRNLKAPPRQRKRGFPSSKRDKAGYELNVTQKGKKLKVSGGGSMTSPRGRKAPTCGSCNLTGHTKQHCQKKQLQDVAVSMRAAM